LVHVSQLGEGFIKNANEVVKPGEKVKVRYDGTDEQGRHNFSMKGIE
jgi:predicted RNA-binding protein with RPS1 domain